jgi:hypothetical protein
MPASHRRYAGWTIERIRRDAAAIGASVATLCELILEERSHPEQGFRACLGIVRLIKAFGTERVEAAAARALEISARTFGSVKSILDNNLDRQAAPKRAEDGALTHPEWLALLLGREIAYRSDKKLAARLRHAKLRQQALFEDVDYRAVRGLDRPLFQKLVAGDWIDAHENL